MFSSISGFDSDSRSHFVSKAVQRFIYLIKIEHFVFMESACLPRREFVLYILNWTNPNDTDVYLEFRVRIWVLEPISSRLSPDIHLFDL